MRLSYGLGLPPGGAVPFNPVSLFSKYSASGLYHNFAGSPTRYVDSGSLLVPMYQDEDGVTVVDADGESIGLAIDESQGAAVGDEEVTNGGFDTDSDWVKGTSWTISGGKLNSPGTNSTYQDLSGITAGDRCVVTFTVADTTTGNVQVYVGGNLIYNSGVTGTFTRIAEFTSSQCIQFTAANSWDGSIDDVSVKIVSGNHAYQTTAAAKPTWKTGSPNWADCDGGDYLDSGLAPASAMTLCACFRATSSDVVVGADEGGTKKTYLGCNASGYLGGGWGSQNWATITGSTSIAGSDVVGLLRANGSAVELWQDGSSVYSASPAGAVGTLDLWVGALNDGISGFAFTTGRIYRVFAIQAYLNDADVASLSSALGAGVTV